jgi:hypothetical protein
VVPEPEVPKVPKPVEGPPKIIAKKSKILSILTKGKTIVISHIDVKRRKIRLK